MCFDDPDGSTYIGQLSVDTITFDVGTVGKWLKFQYAVGALTALPLKNGTGAVRVKFGMSDGQILMTGNSTLEVGPINISPAQNNILIYDSDNGVYDDGDFTTNNPPLGDPIKCQINNHRVFFDSLIIDGKILHGEDHVPAFATVKSQIDFSTNNVIEAKLDATKQVIKLNKNTNTIDIGDGVPDVYLGVNNN